MEWRACDRHEVHLITYIEALGMVQSIRGTVALLPQVAQQIHVIALFSLEVSVKKCTRRSRV